MSGTPNLSKAHALTLLVRQNVQAMDIQCNICKSTFLKTTRAPELTQHAVNKHSKTLPECFPTFQAA